MGEESQKVVQLKPQSIQLTYKDILQSSLMRALKRLTQERFNQQVSYEIGKLFQKLTKAHQTALQGQMDIINKFAQKNEQGQLVPDPNGQIAMKSPEDLVAAEAQLETYMQTAFQVDRRPLPVMWLTAAVSAEELLALEPVLSGVDELEKVTQTRD